MIQKSKDTHRRTKILTEEKCSQKKKDAHRKTKILTEEQ
jgi:hypothetical protein